MMSDARQAWIERAKQAAAVERYDDMAAAMKKVIESSPVLSNQERALLSVAYGKVIEGRKSAWRILSSIEQKTEGSKQRQQMTKEYREKVESEIAEICGEVQALLDNLLIPNSSNAAIKVWYLKMKTEYYWHLVDVTTVGKKNDGGEMNPNECTSPPVKQFSSAYSTRVIGDLSDEDLAEVFKHLPPHDRLLTSEVCKRWYAISRMPWLDVSNLQLTEHDYDRCLGAILKQCPKLRTFFADHLIPENMKVLHAFAQMRLSSLKLDCPECDLPEQDSREYDMFLAMFSEHLPEACWEELVLNELHLDVHVNNFESAYGCSVRTSLPVSLKRLQLSGGIQFQLRGSEGAWWPTSPRLLEGLGRLENLTCLLLDGMETSHCALNRAIYSSDTYRALEALTSLVELGISWTRLSFQYDDHEDIARFCYGLPQLEVLFLNNVRCWQSEEYLGKLTTKHPKLRIFVITGVFRGGRTVPLRRRYPNGFGSDPLPLLHVFLGKSASSKIVLTRSSSDALMAYPITEALPSFFEKEEIAPIFDGVWIAEQIKEGARNETGIWEYVGPAATLIRIAGD